MNWFKDIVLLVKVHLSGNQLNETQKWQVAMLAEDTFAQVYWDIDILNISSIIYINTHL